MYNIITTKEGARKMKGTEKQISWATKILDNINKTFELSKSFPASPAVKERMAAMLTAINSADYAGDLIHLFGDIQFNGDVKHDLPQIIAQFKVAAPATEGEKKILMK